MTVCAIHQPNFFPWLGYFDKIRRSDIFIFLDEVAYPKSGSGTGSWVNRVKILIDGSPAWIGCPVRREHGAQMIRKVRIDDRQPWRKKLLRTLQINYGKSRNFCRAMQIIEPLVLYETDQLAQFNTHAVRRLCEALKVRGVFASQSDLQVAGKATELLINLTKSVGADEYLCGDGSGGYLVESVFQQNNIKLTYQNFVCNSYADPENFVPGLSIIDFLMRASDSVATPSTKAGS
ncbi:MAG TPA: WbqC family protein [Pyrinomonadaceae bacterium]|nr:WbqC family protein [Pyrinomonadaceae bacterium]